MALAVPKIILTGANLAAGNAGAYFQFANVVVNTAGANLNVVIGAGVYYANTPTNCSIVTNITGSNLTLVAANAGPTLFISDGVNFWANTTTNGTLVLLTVNGGANASSTFVNF